MPVKYVRERAGKRYRNSGTAHLRQSEAKLISLSRSSRLVMISSLVLIGAFMVLDKAIQKKPHTASDTHNASAILVSKTAQQESADSEASYWLEMKLTSGILADSMCKVDVSAEDYEKVQQGDAAQVTFRQDAETGEIDVSRLSWNRRESPLS